MATFGLLIAMLVNVFFIQSTGFDWVVSIGVVLVFSGTHRLRHPGDQEHVLRERWPGRDGPQGDLRRLPCSMALSSTLFIWILHILGMMRGD